MNQYRERTNQKLGYAKIHLEEIKNYSNSTSNDEWENAHQESFFYQLTGAVESILHEINYGYSLGLALHQVTWKTVKDNLTNSTQTSSGFDLITNLRNDSSSWLSQLFVWRNYGTHRGRVGKIVYASTWQKVDNEFKDPRTNKNQTVYPGKGCLDVLECLKNDVEDLINNCRKIDTKL